MWTWLFFVDLSANGDASSYFLLSIDFVLVVLYFSLSNFSFFAGDNPPISFFLDADMREQYEHL